MRKLALSISFAAHWLVSGRSFPGWIWPIAVAHSLRSAHMSHGTLAVSSPKLLIICAHTLHWKATTKPPTPLVLMSGIHRGRAVHSIHNLEGALFLVLGLAKDKWFDHGLNESGVIIHRGLCAVHTIHCNQGRVEMVALAVPLAVLCVFFPPLRLNLPGLHLREPYNRGP